MVTISRVRGHVHSLVLQNMSKFKEWRKAVRLLSPSDPSKLAMPGLGGLLAESMRTLTHISVHSVAEIQVKTEWHPLA